jgi:hypothetical protein
VPPTDSVDGNVVAPTHVWSDELVTFELIDTVA